MPIYYKLDRLLIAGIDPGTVGAYALLDLDGNLVYFGSDRGLGYNNIIRNITEHGKIFLIGCDVCSVPPKIGKIARILGARIVAPDHNLGYLEKIKLVDRFLKVQKGFIKLRNKHEKDALASALYGLKKINTLIKKIDDHLKQNNKKHLIESVKRKVLLENFPISKAVKLLS